MARHSVQMRLNHQLKYKVLNSINGEWCLINSALLSLGKIIIVQMGSIGNPITIIHKASAYYHNCSLMVAGVES